MKENNLVQQELLSDNINFSKLCIWDNVLGNSWIFIFTFVQFREHKKNKTLKVMNHTSGKKWGLTPLCLSGGIFRHVFFGHWRWDTWFYIFALKISSKQNKIQQIKMVFNYIVEVLYHPVLLLPILTFFKHQCANHSSARMQAAYTQCYHQHQLQWYLNGNKKISWGQDALPNPISTNRHTNKQTNKKTWF